jgi:glycerol-3-phosphate dehydrogenase
MQSGAESYIPLEIWKGSTPTWRECPSLRSQMISRSETIQKIVGNPFDVCVIGGGATGAGCALDAQLRKLKTVLVDAGDFASAASSASTKLIHGGVRYLEQALKKLSLEEYRMVQRALRERVHMLANAPHLAQATAFLVPVFSRPEAIYYQVGMKLYDLIAGKDNLFPSRFLSREEAIRRIPSIRREGLWGAVSYSDGQFDDSRYGLALVKSFVEAGGEALNYARVIGFTKMPGGKLFEARIQDSFTKKEWKVHARCFINATGPASDAIRLMARPEAAKRMRPSKGVHILFPLENVSSRDALLVPKTEDGRVIFAVPWQGRLLVGTTDDEATPETRMVVLREEAVYLLRQLNPYLEKPLQMEQIVSGIAGLRPLVASGAARQNKAGVNKDGGTKELIRDHEVEIDAKSGLVSILGGKWTTHRLMAEDTVDAVQRALTGEISPCKTREHRLAGGEGYTANYWQSLVKEFAVGEETARHLAAKFGTRARKMLALIRTDATLGAPLVKGLPPICAEVVYCAREEMAMTIEDILARRIGLQLLDWQKAIEAAPRVGELLAREFHWSAEEERKAVLAYTSKIDEFLIALGLAKG